MIKYNEAQTKVANNSDGERNEVTQLFRPQLSDNSELRGCLYHLIPLIALAAQTAHSGITSQMASAKFKIF